MSVIDRFRLDGKQALITGAHRGIGFAIAEAFCEAGAVVTITGRNVDAVAQSVANLQGKGFEAHGAVMDVRDPQSIQDTVAQVIAARGRIDVLVNNAGIAFENFVLDIPLDEWRTIIDTNLTGPFLVSQAVARDMVKNGGGSIVNIGSNSAFIVDQPQGQAHYNTSKAGLHMLSKAMAVELAPHKIRVNIVAPGYTVTEMTREGLAKPQADVWRDLTPMKRFADAAEMAPAALYLASDASSFVTGESILVEGGYTLW